jgi:signal transduction histidine kinase
MSFNLDVHLLEEIFQSVSKEVQILDAVRDKNNLIIDFRYLAQNRTGNEKREGEMEGFFSQPYFWKTQPGLFEHFVRTVEKDEPFDVKLEFKEGEHSRWFHVKGRKFNNGLILFQEDVTVSKLAEEKIMQLNKALFSKNRQLEALSSELKTFNTIAANDYNETLKHLYTSMEFIINNDAKNLSDAGKANIRRAQAAIQKMKLLTDDIVAFSKINSDERMIPVDLNETLAGVVAGLDEKIRSENAVIRPDKLPIIYGYPTLISLLFYHLLSNSLKFRKKELDPVIDVKHALKKGEEIEHSAAMDTSYNVISFIDNGIGFDPQEGEKIFTMFYRLHEKGKQKGGIGLAICKKIMDLHGGFIDSECNPECTTFRCYFPVQRTVSTV